MKRCEYCDKLLAHWRNPRAKYCDKYCRGYAKNERHRLRTGRTRVTDTCLYCGFSLIDTDLRRKFCSFDCRRDYVIFKGKKRPPCVVCGKAMGRDQDRRMVAHRGACHRAWDIESRKERWRMKSGLPGRK